MTYGGRIITGITVMFLASLFIAQAVVDMLGVDGSSLAVAALAALAVCVAGTLSTLAWARRAER